VSGWKAKRFWSAATVEPCDGGFTVRLDARPVKTPAKAALVVPSQALAQAIADEWMAQTGPVRPDTMPFTRAANSALDKVAVQREEVISLLAAYGETDLLCYRATGPMALIDRQAAQWDPLLHWAATDLDAPLRAVAGVMHIAQPPASLARLRARMEAQSDFELAAFYDLVAITGSLVLALAVSHARLDGDAAWQLSRIDETWQAEQWGRDDEAAAQEALKKAALLQAERFYRLCA